jgi:type VI protein secretion system component VasA
LSASSFTSSIAGAFGAFDFDGDAFFAAGLATLFTAVFTDFLAIQLTFNDFQQLNLRPGRRVSK